MKKIDAEKAREKSNQVELNKLLFRIEESTKKGKTSIRLDTKISFDIIQQLEERGFNVIRRYKSFFFIPEVYYIIYW